MKELNKNFEDEGRNLNKTTAKEHVEKIELSSKEVDNILKEKQLPEFKNKWQGFTDQEKLNHVKDIYSMWKTSGRIDVKRDLDGFLTLKAKSGEWVEPKELLFPKEYKSTQQELEVLAEKGLIDQKLLFVGIEFIEGKNDYETSSWRWFLEDLGVDSKIKDRNFNSVLTERIGVLSALRYEKNHSRSARLLGDSEKPGYDIESYDNEKKRFIEVKSTSYPYYPNISLTLNEAAALKRDSDHYFVYVIRDTLLNPQLLVVPGAELIKLDSKLVYSNFESKSTEEWKVE
jgi:hypothetical protein